MLRLLNHCSVLAFAALAVSFSCGERAGKQMQIHRDPSTPTARAIAADVLASRWAGPAICYSGYREGQAPGTGDLPSDAQILEDLRILERHWRLIRLYSSNVYSERILRLIRDHEIKLSVMLGAWLAKEPDNAAFNAREVERCISLANANTDVVFAVNVGNEALIYWSDHQVSEDAVIAYIREVKANVSVPVTVAENFAWWESHGSRLAAEVDFITVHTYPVWERFDFDRGLTRTIEEVNSVRQALPHKPIIIGEAGWPSYTEGNLHVPRTGNEANQKRYFEELSAWGKENDMTVFFFSAFDEPWKGTGTEGHWGFFTVERKAKLVVRDLFPDLQPVGPTSPSYDDMAEPPAVQQLDLALSASLAESIENGRVNFLGEGIRYDCIRESADALDGAASLLMPFDGDDWAGVYYQFDPFDAGAHDKLVLGLKFPESVSSLELKIEGPAGNARVVNLLRFVTEQSADGWSKCSVPFTALDGVDFTRLAIIGVWNPRNASGEFHACDILLDEIHLN